jgi:glutamate/tyrosine decarboxylase-like PLP-dependent enzyme
MNDTTESASNDGEAPLELEPKRFRELGHRLVDRLADFLQRLDEHAVAPDTTPGEVREALGQAKLPDTGNDPEAALERCVNLLSRFNRLTSHPRQWGYIIGSAAPIGALADMVAATFNPNVVSWQSAAMATEIENQTVGWIAELVGYPPEGAGLMVSGGNLANFVGFFAARRHQADWDIRRRGLGDERARRLCAYVSAETHTWVEKAADLSGIGTDAVRWVATDAERRMDPDALVEQIEHDLGQGYTPFLIVGTAGTVSTGAVDPLPRLAEIANSYNLWFHVDGAYGAPAILASGTPSALAGMRAADSLAIDPHKWLYVPLEAGCVLVRKRQHLTDTFSYLPPYYQGHRAGGEDLTNFHEMGLQNSRGFRALKVWMVLQQAGRDGLKRMIERDIEHARLLHRAMHDAPDFEAVSQALSITTFRYTPQDIADGAYAEPYLNRLNEALMSAIQKSGKAYLSNAVVDGRFVLRTCITNFRTRAQDVQTLPATIRQIARALDETLRVSHPELTR